MGLIMRHYGPFPWGNRPKMAHFGPSHFLSLSCSRKRRGTAAGRIGANATDSFPLPLTCGDASMFAGIDLTDQRNPEQASRVSAKHPSVRSLNTRSMAIPRRRCSFNG